MGVEGRDGPAVPAEVAVGGDEVQRRVSMERRVGSVGDQPGRVQRADGMGIVLQRRDVRSFDDGLVADAPKADAGVVVVLAHHFARDPVPRVGRRGGVGVAVFGPDDDALLISQIIFQRGVGVMGQAHEVHAEFMQVIPVPPQIVLGDGGGVLFGLLVLCHPAQVRPRAVQEEAGRCHLEESEAGPLRHRVRRLPVHAGLRRHLV